MSGDPKSHANFGTSVDLSRLQVGNFRSNDDMDSVTWDHDSYDIVIGASLATGVASVTGAAYVYRSPVATYNRRSPYVTQWTQLAKLYALDGYGDERFGSSVAIDGPYIAVGAPEDR